VNAAVERATALSDFTRVEESGTKLNSATYANYTKAEKWTKEDTEFFFQALRQFGTDFSLIQRLFPGRSRRQIKKKYLVEDKIEPRARRGGDPEPQPGRRALQKPHRSPQGAGGRRRRRRRTERREDRCSRGRRTRRDPDPALPAPPEASARERRQGRAGARGARGGDTGARGPGGENREAKTRRAGGAGARVLATEMIDRCSDKKKRKRR
jgi:hypothetical protein